jgi:hypothetical protein
MSDTVTINFSNVGERIWLLEAMGTAISSKKLFMACEDIAPTLSPSQELIKDSGLIINEVGVPMWNKDVDTSLVLDVPKIILEGIKESVFGPTVVNDRTISMIDKLSLWTVHE